MEAGDAVPWLDDYLSAFAALGRGDRDDPRLLLDYYAVPLLLTTDDAVVVLTTEDEVVNAVERQIGALRAAGYHRSETLTSEVSVLNARTALYAAEFSRQRADGSEIERLAVTYVMTVGAAGRRISAVIVRTG